MGETLEPGELTEHESQEPEGKKVQLVPVEQLIAGIKPASEIKQLEGVGYGTEELRDSFIYGFFEQEIATIVQSKEYEGFFSQAKSDLDVLRERMKDQIVIDLGSDMSYQGYLLASLLGAKGYVGVDLFSEGSLENLTEKNIKTSLEERLSRNLDPDEKERLKRKIENNIKPEVIPASIVKGDMLDFLRRLPDNSVSIFTFGISSEIIQDGKYEEEMRKEIQRVLSFEGGCLTLESGIIRPTGLNNLFRELWEKGLTNAGKGVPEYSVSPLFIEGNPGLFVKK